MRVVAIFVAAMSVGAVPSAWAGFSVEGLPAVASERGAMADRDIYTRPARATFKSPTGDLKPRQARYKDAVLLVDLAYTPLTQRGDGTAERVEGFGDDLPFTSGMSMIVPRGWHIYRADHLDKKAIPERISYVGGKAWPEVLRDLGERYALHFHLDWYDQTVMIDKGRVMNSAASMTVIPEPVVAPKVVSKPIADKTVSAATATNAGSASSHAKTATASAVSTGAGADKPLAATPPKPKPVAPPAPVFPTWTVSAADETYRQALRKWAKAAAWTFEPEHWAVPLDIPITAAASFRGDFRTAVQQFVSTTELSETPLQPCFYSNKVVRIVPYNEMCDRMSVR
ncbi:hypothetical protein SSTU70S_02824 [Stutzerimonas stutzeri]